MKLSFPYRLGLFFVGMVLIGAKANAMVITREFLVRNGINPNAATQALDAFDRLRFQIGNQEVITIVDYTLPSYTRRMSIIHTGTGQIERYLVTHGKKSGEEWVERTSNQLAFYSRGTDFNSFRSPTGTFLTDSTKMSARTGYSLTVRGMDDPGNISAFDRYIYIHGKVGVNLEYKRKNGKVIQSEGCFVVDKPYTNHVVDTLKGGSLLFVYWNQADLEANKLRAAGIQ
jgi:hypothetical protein